MRAAVALIAAALAGCAFPKRAAVLPRRYESWIAVLSGEMPDPISEVARHSWIVASLPPSRNYLRWELGSEGHTRTRPRFDGSATKRPTSRSAVELRAELDAGRRARVIRAATATWIRDATKPSQ